MKYLIIEDEKIVNIVIGEVSGGTLVTAGLSKAVIGDEIKNGKVVKTPINIDYAQERSIKYPPITEQIDMLYHAMKNGEISKAKDFFSTLDKVKKKYPKL